MLAVGQTVLSVSLEPLDSVPRAAQTWAMSIVHANLDHPLLTAAQERELARQIEAGLYAQQLLDSGQARPGLAAVIRQAEEARQQFWQCNLRLVFTISVQLGRRHDLSIDELFQEGCLALAEAINRFDHARGFRFVSLAYPYISGAIAASARKRCGALFGQATGQLVTALNEATAAATTQPTAAESWTDCLDLLGSNGQLLRWRYGIGCRQHTLAEVAELLGMSITTVVRREAAALRQVRRILAGDQCRLTPLPPQQEVVFV